LYTGFVRVLVVAAALAILAQRPLQDIDVRVASGRVVIRTQGAPLSRVLDRLGNATGMKVVYQGPAPMMPIRADVDAASESEALARLMEGQGVDYALRMDPSGYRVEYLIVGSVARGGSAAAGTAAIPPMPTMPAPGMPPSEALDEDADGEIDFPEGMPPQMVPGGQFTPPVPVVSPPTVPPPGFPMFPQGASRPPFR
jgi:hypothetical protein